MKYVYVSLPMNGKSRNEIANRLRSINSIAKEKAHAKFGWDVKDIQTIDNFWDHLFPDNEEMLTKEERIIYLGSGIRKLAEADAIYFDEGWVKSMNCLIESTVAVIYDIPVIMNGTDIDICEKEEKADEE